MTESEYLSLISETLDSVEEAVSNLDPDIDCEGGDGILKLTFPTGVQVILNKQAPIKQLWVAGKSQGYHFDYIDHEWIDNRSKKSFLVIFNEICSEAAGYEVKLVL